MDEFAIIYVGQGTPDKMPKSKEEGMAHRQKWMEWVASLGDAVVSPGQPMMEHKLVSSEGVSDVAENEKFTGFAVVKAENIEAAIEIAKSDPFLNMGGGVQVAKMMKMPG
ncbi:MAG: hypothetical protein COC24_004895 [Alphaproteobacteria bacterium]|nr:hypothetical protein [Alphaproteobacteria bacterium]